jgi:DNA-binding NarL/FixJ family response regulator
MSSIGAVTITCLIIDDHPLFRRGLIETLLNLPGIAVLAETASVEEALELPENPGVVLLDLSLEKGGLMKEGAVEALLKRWPHAPILVLTASESKEDLLSMLAAGASGYITKHAKPAELGEALRLVAQGEVFVTPRLASFLLEEDNLRPRDEWSLSQREREVLRLVAEGERDQDIAGRLTLSIKTVQSHLTRIRDKTGMRRRADLTRLAIEKGLLRPPSMS